MKVLVALAESDAYPNTKRDGYGHIELQMSSVPRAGDLISLSEYDEKGLLLVTNEDLKKHSPSVVLYSPSDTNGWFRVNEVMYVKRGIEYVPWLSIEPDTQC